MGTELTIALIELIIKYGPTTAISLIKSLESDSPTSEQIRALKVESPEHYFGDNDGN